ncbi:hypothetical protein AB0D27_10895 [Streptomyces sp. NPDC048415]|uniref:hypothetical protein n=1 Tax=Streptomyces sp. NPDC048415 TaxID=3154822 RepID=UPI0034398123
MKNIKRSLGAAASLVSILGTSVILAPSASATPAGCGELSNGNLCISGGKLGKSATYTWTVGYSRNTSGQIIVTLGDQRKNDQITALPNYYGSKKTSSVSNYAELSQKHSIDAGDCIRGVMEYKGTMYVTKWRCP